MSISLLKPSAKSKNVRVMPAGGAPAREASNDSAISSPGRAITNLSSTRVRSGRPSPHGPAHVVDDRPPVASTIADLQTRRLQNEAGLLRRHVVAGEGVVGPAGQQQKRRRGRWRKRQRERVRPRVATERQELEVI